jgi:hypothetical protein
MTDVYAFFQGLVKAQLPSAMRGLRFEDAGPQRSTFGKWDFLVAALADPPHAVRILLSGHRKYTL